MDDIAALEGAKVPSLFLSYEESIGTSNRVPYLIDGFLYECGLNMIFGPANSGKSAIMLSAAHAIALGRDWHGRATKRVPVYLFAAEDPEGIMRRRAALDAREGVESRLLHISSHAVDFSSAHDRKTVLAFLESAAPGCVIFDTLSECAGEFNLNDPGRDARAITRFLHQIETLGHTPVIVHHSGWGTSKREFGAVSFRNSAHVVLKVSATTNAVTILVDKNRHAPKGDRYTGRIEGAEFAPGATAAVYVPATYTPAAKSSSAEPSILSPSAVPPEVETVVDALRRRVAGESPAGLAQADWRRAASDAHPTEVGEKRFARIVRRAVDEKLVTVSGSGRGALYRPTAAA